MPDNQKRYYFVDLKAAHPYIRAANIDGSADELVIQGRDYGYGDPAVSPDGRWLAYMGGWPGNIYIRCIRTSNLKHIQLWNDLISGKIGPFGCPSFGPCSLGFQFPGYQIAPKEASAKKGVNPK